VKKNKCLHDHCHLDVYDGENRCIFHCEKTKDNGWIIDEEASYVDSKWNSKKVQEFWKKDSNEQNIIFPKDSLIPPLYSYEIFQKKDESFTLNLSNCKILDDFNIDEDNIGVKFSLYVYKSTFNGKLSLFNFINRSNHQIDIHLEETIHHGNIEISSQSIDDVWINNITVNKLRLGIGEGKSPNQYESIFISNDNDKYKIENINVKNTNVANGFILKDTVVNSLDCSNSNFEGKVKIINSNIKKFTSFENTIFKQVADFSNTTFYQNNFTNTLFEDTTSFIESKFCDDIDFKYTVFEKLVIFRKAIFEKSINLEDSIIKGEANFLNITSKNRKINIANKETARIIKHSFDKVGNTIEANKYFAYEMKKERKNTSFKDDFNKKAMLNLNYWISDFGQSWIRPLIIIFVVAILHTLLIYGINNPSLKVINPSNSIYDFLKWIVDFTNNLAYNILPFKKLLIHGQEFISLVFLIIYSTLIYNFIVAVKRITKR